MSRATIAIVGDSWAESMWRIQGTDILVNGHIHGILEKNGCRVCNFGIVGSGNLDSWELYEKILDKKKIFPDLTLWFHTEVLRDYQSELHNTYQHNKEWTLQDLLSKAADSSYKKIKKIIEKYNVDNIVLIEGQAPVVEPEFSKHIPSPVYTVKSWRNKILNMPDLPETQILPDVNIFEYGQNLDSIDTKVQELNNIKSIRDAMANSSLFPDDTHPGREAYEQLASKILEFMNKTNH